MNMRILVWRTGDMCRVHPFNAFWRLSPLNLFLHLTWTSPLTAVMHQHTTGHIVGVVVCDLEIVDLDRTFQQLMLNLFYDDILTIDKDENVTRTEVRCIRPALDRTIERVRRRGNNFLAARKNVRQLCRLVDIGFDDLILIKNPYQRFLKFQSGTEIIKKQQKASKVIEIRIGGFCCFYTSC